MASILEYAKLSQAVYDDEGGQPEGWKLVAFQPSGKGLTNAFQGGAYTRDGELVIACKGTSQGRDILADVKLGIGMNSSQFSRAEKFAKKLANSGPKKVTVTGHSLGGAIAQIVGNRQRLPFVTFNAPGVGLMSRNVDEMLASTLGGAMAVRIAFSVVSVLRHPMQAARDVGAAFHKVTGLNLRHGKDVVGLIGVHYGKVLEVPLGGDFGLMDKHKIGPFIETLTKNPIGKRSPWDVLGG